MVCKDRDLEEHHRKNLETLEELKKAKNIKITRFKNHDRVYWESSGMRITGTLKCKVEEIATPELRNFLMKHVED